MVKTCRSLQSLQLQIIRFEKSMKLGMGIGIKKNIPIQFQFPFHIERTKPIGRTKHEEIARNDNYKKKKEDNNEFKVHPTEPFLFIDLFISFLVREAPIGARTVSFDLIFHLIFYLFFFLQPETGHTARVGFFIW